MKCCHCFCIECLATPFKRKRIHNNGFVCLECHTVCPNNGKDLFYSKMQEFAIKKYFNDEFNDIFNRTETNQKK